MANVEVENGHNYLVRVRRFDASSPDELVHTEEFRLRERDDSHAEKKALEIAGKHGMIRKLPGGKLGCGFTTAHTIDVSLAPVRKGEKVVTQVEADKAAAAENEKRLAAERAAASERVKKDEPKKKTLSATTKAKG